MTGANGQLDGAYVTPPFIKLRTSMFARDASGNVGAVLAVLIGVNVGPNLSYPGSLSNLLWRSVVRRDRLPAGFAEFSLVGLWTVPLTLVVSVFGLWGGIEVFGL